MTFSVSVLRLLEMKNAPGAVPEPSDLLAGQSTLSTVLYQRTHSPSASPSPKGKITSACICPEVMLWSRMTEVLTRASLRGAIGAYFQGIPNSVTSSVSSPECS